MLVHYQFSNFCSFEEETDFSMRSSRRKMARYEDNEVALGGERILKSAVIVGENAGGKSNFIQGIAFLQALFNTKDTVTAVKKYINYNALEKGQDTQHFQIEAAISRENKTFFYRYTLDLNLICVINEKLEIKTEKKQDYEIIFVKESEKLFNNASVYASQLKCNRKYISDYTDKAPTKGLAITLLSLLGYEIVKPFVDWVNDTLIIEAPNKNNIDQYRYLKNEEEDLKILHEDTYLEIFQLVDDTITAIKVDADRPYQDTLIIRKTRDGSEVKTLLSDESSGVREFFIWAVQIWRVVYQNKVLFADEMDRVLNPILAQRIIAYVHGSDHHGQMIFTTHNVLHLNTIDFMKEQLWFIVKHGSDLTSEMYSLADFKDFRYDKKDIYDWYMKGVVGGAVYD